MIGNPQASYAGNHQAQGAMFQPRLITGRVSSSELTWPRNITSSNR